MPSSFVPSFAVQFTTRTSPSLTLAKRVISFMRDQLKLTLTAPAATLAE